MMWLRRLLGGGNNNDSRILHLYVACNHCHTPVHVRVDLYNDLTLEYDDREQAVGFVLRKEIMDARCFRLMHAEILFDTTRRETRRTVEGGVFVDESVYNQHVATTQK